MEELLNIPPALLRGRAAEQSKCVIKTLNYCTRGLKHIYMS